MSNGVGRPQSGAIDQPGIEVSDEQVSVAPADLSSARLDDVEIFFLDVGPRQGPTTLLVHGLGGSWSAWSENVADLAETRRVVAVDLPGFGASPANTTVVTIAAYARVLEQLCAHLGITDVVAVGSSLGGWICTELTLRAPELVSGLVLIDAAGIPPTRRERIKVVSMLVLADRMSPWACRHRDLLINNLALRRRALGFAVVAPERLAPDLVAALLPENPSPVFRRVLRAATKSWSVSWCDLVTEITVPALIIWGEQDAQLPLRHGHEWVRLIRESRLVVVPATGHLPMLEDPQTVNRELREFADGLANTSRFAGKHKQGSA